MSQEDLLVCDMKGCDGFPFETETNKCMNVSCISRIHDPCTNIYGDGDGEMYCSYHCVILHAHGQDLEADEAWKILNSSCHEAFKGFEQLWSGPGGSISSVDTIDDEETKDQDEET